MTMTDETLGRELAAKFIQFLETGSAPDKDFSRQTRSVISLCPSGAFRHREQRT